MVYDSQYVDGGRTALGGPSTQEAAAFVLAAVRKRVGEAILSWVRLIAFT